MGKTKKRVGTERKDLAGTKKNNRKTGTDYERAAGYYLEQQGYKIMQYNFRCKAGEIDIVAKDGNYLVFCEVKYRSDESLGSPLEAVDLRKQNRIFGAAQWYVTQRHLEDAPCRFDVIGIAGTKISHIKNAFAG